MPPTVLPANPTAISLLTTEQTAEMLHVSTGHLANLRSQGTSPLAFVRLGSRAIRYRYGDVVDFISKQTIVQQGACA